MKQWGQKSLRWGCALALIGFFVSGSIAACKNGNAEKETQTEQSIGLLQTHIGKLESRIDDLEEELRSQRASLKNPSNETTPGADNNQVISETRYSPNDSYLDDPFIGIKNAKILVMTFTNYQCKPCRLFHKTSFQELRERYINNDHVRLVLRDFPLESTPWSVQAASLAHCAGEGGGYWKMFDILNSQIELVDREDLQGLAERYDRLIAPKLIQCVNSKRYIEEIEKDRQDGLELGARGAPGTFVGKKQSDGEFRGVFIRGAQPAALIDQEIKKFLGGASDTQHGTPGGRS